MVNENLIHEFFEEELSNSSQIFLYKDKKLLSEKKYREFAEEQIIKARNIFLGASFFLFIVPIYAIWYLFQAGMESSYLQFGLGALYFVMFALSVWKVSKEFYTIRSSMRLLIRLLNVTEKDEV